MFVVYNIEYRKTTSLNKISVDSRLFGSGEKLGVIIVADE
jgi:hypothetical protein